MYDRANQHVSRQFGGPSRTTPSTGQEPKDSAGATVHKRSGQVGLSPAVFECFGGRGSGFAVAASDSSKKATPPPHIKPASKANRLPPEMPK
jgi:hypothetical protein